MADFSDPSGPETRPMSCPECHANHHVLACHTCPHTGVVPDVQLSKNFWLSSFLRSDKAVRYGIPNEADEREIGNIRQWCQEIGEPLIVTTGEVPFISSGLRSPALNLLIKGAKSSSHLYENKANAADTTWKMHRVAVMNYLIASRLPVDQVIAESRPKPDGTTERWIHASSRHSDGSQRQQFLQSFDGATYSTFDPSHFMFKDG